MLSPESDLLLLAHAAVTWALVGLIWTVQCVQYPLFAAVPSEGFLAYHAGHMRRITIVVGPLMLAELLAAAAIAIRTPSASLAWVGIALLASVWIVTWSLSVPCHDRLAKGFDPAVHRRLVRTNWLRTAAWTLRGVVAFLLLAAPSAGGSS